MSSRPPHQKAVAWSLIASMALASGCSPNVASTGDDQTISSTSAPKAVPTAVSNPGKSSLPSNPMAMGKMSPEEMKNTLAAMAPEERSKVVLRFLSFTLLFFYSVYHRYPTAEEGLEILLSPPPGPEGKVYDPFARDILLLDGWDRKVQFSTSTFSGNLPGFKLRSLGPDGVESGDDIFPDVEDVTIQVTGTIAAGGLDNPKPTPN